MRKERGLESFRGAMSVMALILATFSALGVVTGASGAVAKYPSSQRQVGTVGTPLVVARTLPYPVGAPSESSPSHYAPPGPNALSGYRLSYVSNFSGSSVPAGWDVFTGVPTGNGGGQWALSHVVVSNGVLQLNTFQDPQYGNEWVAGGLCQCGHPQTYGAFFVRSRMTGPGATQVEMLWPMSGWPPEVDFSETFGGVSSTMATDHEGPDNIMIHRSLQINMTQWHTWGVIWTPTSLTYVVDAHVWGRVVGASHVPSQPMTLHIQQQTWCAASRACPTSPESTLVDWVAEYVPSTN